MPAAAPSSSSGVQARTLRYQRHRPGQTLLYKIVAQHYPVFVAHMAGKGRTLPEYVQAEFESYLKCSQLEHGFLRVRCDTCRAAR